MGTLYCVGFPVLQVCSHCEMVALHLKVLKKSDSVFVQKKSYAWAIQE